MHDRKWGWNIYTAEGCTIYLTPLSVFFGTFPIEIYFTM